MLDRGKSSFPLYKKYTLIQFPHLQAIVKMKSFNYLKFVNGISVINNDAARVVCQL